MTNLSVKGKQNRMVEYIPLPMYIYFYRGGGAVCQRARPASGICRRYSNHSRNRPKSLKQVVTAPLLNAR